MFTHLSNNIKTIHNKLRGGKEIFLIDYLLSLSSGETFWIMGGCIRNSQAILRYERAKDVRSFQSLSEKTIVLLNGEEMPLNKVYREKIGRDYLPRPRFIGIDDSKEIINELIRGRRY